MAWRSDPEKTRKLRGRSFVKRCACTSLGRVKRCWPRDEERDRVSHAEGAEIEARQVLEVRETRLGRAEEVSVLRGPLHRMHRRRREELIPPECNGSLEAALPHSYPTISAAPTLPHRARSSAPRKRGVFRS